MPRTQKHDPDILHAALVGFQHAMAALEQRIADLRGRLTGEPASAKTAASAPSTKKRTMSASARKRIGLAQKKRWAAYNAAKTKPKPAAAKPPKRELSAEGRARIIAATKKRWAAFRKSQQAPKPAAKKAGKSIAKKAPAAAAPPAAAASAPASE